MTFPPQPATSTRWHGKIVYVYVHPALDAVSLEISEAAIQAINDSADVSDMQDRLGSVADDHDAELLSLIDQPDHSDPLGIRISIAFGPLLTEDGDD